MNPDVSTEVAKNLPAYPQSSQSLSGDNSAGYPPSTTQFTRINEKKDDNPQDEVSAPLPPELILQGFHPAVVANTGNFPVYIQQHPGAGDLEDQLIKGFDFTDKSIRRAFVRKMYAILMCQILVTFGMIMAFMTYVPYHMWARNYTFLLIIAMLVAMGSIVAISFCDGVRRSFPWNIIFLGIYTVSIGFMLSCISSKYQAKEVILAVGITAAICFALTMFAMQTKFDFTMMGGSLLCALLVLVIFGMILVFYEPSRTFRTVFSAIGVLLFSIYLVYDTQLMIGGNHRYTISPEEYIFAALSLYCDITNIFIRVLYLSSGK